jgi:hypothetical protein
LSECMALIYESSCTWANLVCMLHFSGEQGGVGAAEAHGQFRKPGL